MENEMRRDRHGQIIHIRSTPRNYDETKTNVPATQTTSCFGSSTRKNHQGLRSAVDSPPQNQKVCVCVNIRTHAVPDPIPPDKAQPQGRERGSHGRADKRQPTYSELPGEGWTRTFGP